MTCPFCERPAPLVRHHAKTRRTGDEIIRMCRDCERVLHGLYSNRALRQRADLQTIAGLLADEAFMLAVSHVRRLPVGQFMRMRQRRTRDLRTP